MRIIGKSPHFTIKDFGLGYTDTASFIGCLVSSGEKILFPYFDVNFKNDDKDWEEFILSRTVYYSESWSYQDVTYNNIYWVRPQNEKELIKLMEYAGGNIHLYVVPSGKNLETYHLFISLIGQVTEGNIEFVTININETIIGYFEKQVLPKLIKNFTGVSLESRV
jgi:hypothetical protein